jgi:hypothetical protein
MLALGRKQPRRAAGPKLDPRRDDRAVDPTCGVLGVEMHREHARDLDHLVDLDRTAFEALIESLGRRRLDGLFRHASSGK